MHPSKCSGLARNSIAVRLALMFALAALAVFALLGAGLYRVLLHEQNRHQHEEIQGRLEEVRYVLVHSRSPRLAQIVREKIEAISAADHHTHIWMWSADPAYRYGDGAEQIAHPFQHAGPSGRMLSLAIESQKPSMMLLGAALPANGPRPALVLVAGNDSLSFARTLHTFGGWLLLLSLAGAALVAAFGYGIARAGLLPLTRMSADAHSIGPDNRGQHLALSPLPRELLHLGQSFNAALERLDSAYRRLETFNADVAHELRTPLANLIGQTQVTLARERQAPALHEVLQSNLEELERLRAIVADMLFLARAEQGERACQRVESSIAAEVGKTIEFFDLLLEEARMRVNVQGDALAPIETALLRRALSNLLQNAIQHSPPGAAIEVRITRDPHSAAIAFSNPGGPIAPEQLARLFDRFYRIDTARRNSDASHGLGLAIVKAVAAMHDGAVFARAQDGHVTVGFSVALGSAAAATDQGETSTQKPRAQGAP
ncbi:MAG: heavy metal sensor histidine kinase [Burkholderiaceae bacterium]|jgi:two-component system heavy metal sensor histidine kinase CusS|nr:heavy metal sensor histidine kinase [Burkholderiaceae bacterium]